MNSNTKIADTYRPDIDGLRAIAVSAVMIFHAKENLLPGGFVGVDIFFVISGYLITKHIAAEISANRFSLGEFYRRRIRRIVPMMMVVVATTLLLSMLLMTPADARNVAKSAVWSIASMANIHFLRDLDSSYFAASSAEVPLLHLWSLGVEEQFYFFWPLLLVVAQRRLGPVVMIGLTLLLTVSSFELAAQLLPDNASFAYYMLPTRMGELLIGGILGLAAALTHWRVSKRLANLSGWLGIALITCSLAFIDRTQPFP
ncbi:MAG: acyltransferase, partial [Aquabacterium sp.]|nr:acyltransferase [Aquabacterium sp.]